MTNFFEQARASRAWPFEEAIRILEHIKYTIPKKKGYVLFETGYGPSGLPHIGTFGEVARTTMVRNAFMKLSDIPTKLICFSDDMDGLRKVPTNVPKQEMLLEYLDMPLTSVPDPFMETASYGHYMNAKLKSFLDKFGFDYEFRSSTECYKRGDFDEMLLKVMDKYEEIMNLMLPTFRDERRATYSPFMPICPETGKVLQVPIESINRNKKTIEYRNKSGELVETIVTGGKCKLQWKPDFGMRWAALDVDYEMYGKDHKPNAELYSKIAEILGGKAPVQFFYELFLNEEGQKISKSKGNSITIDEWLTYATLESLSLFMYQSPTKAKRLHFDVIPKNVDEYITFNKKYHLEVDFTKKISNPLYHIHNGEVPEIENYGLSFILLLNLASVCNPDDKAILWGFISKYAPEATPNSAPFLDDLVGFAVNYYNDIIKQKKIYLQPNEQQKIMLSKIENFLSKIDYNVTAEELQNTIFAIGTEENYANLRDFFKEIYMILLGQEEGPRLGSFIKLYGIKETINLIQNKLK